MTGSPQGDRGPIRPHLLALSVHWAQPAPSPPQASASLFPPPGQQFQEGAWLGPSLYSGICSKAGVCSERPCLPRFIHCGPGLIIFFNAADVTWKGHVFIVSAPSDCTYHEVRDFVLPAAISLAHRSNKISWGQQGGDKDEGSHPQSQETPQHLSWALGLSSFINAVLEIALGH